MTSVLEVRDLKYTDGDTEAPLLHSPLPLFCTDRSGRPIQDHRRGDALTAAEAPGVTTV